MQRRRRISIFLRSDGSKRIPGNRQKTSCRKHGGRQARMSKERKEVEIPDLSVAAKKRKRLHGRSRFSDILNSTIAILLVAAAAAIAVVVIAGIAGKKKED